MKHLDQNSNKYMYINTGNSLYMHTYFILFWTYFIQTNSKRLDTSSRKLLDLLLKFNKNCHAYKIKIYTEIHIQTKTDYLNLEDSSIIITYFIIYGHAYSIDEYFKSLQHSNISFVSFISAYHNAGQNDSFSCLSSFL